VCESSDSDFYAGGGDGFGGGRYGEESRSRVLLCFFRTRDECSNAFFFFQFILFLFFYSKKIKNRTGWPGSSFAYGYGGERARKLGITAEINDGTVKSGGFWECLRVYAIVCGG
jgi:hypothetical protein